GACAEGARAFELGAVGLDSAGRSKTLVEAHGAAVERRRLRLASARFGRDRIAVSKASDWERADAEGCGTRRDRQGDRSVWSEGFDVQLLVEPDAARKDRRQFAANRGSGQCDQEL